ncbi:MAG TPA: hypothetical protein PKE27_10715 [Povalibacter sp.]|nr:hypothetical protein [Povalibacter sp.]HMN45038.1 hypothetical protein [Povalibacter sp.]
MRHPLNEGPAESELQELRDAATRGTRLPLPGGKGLPATLPRRR